jgi:hypothetical protein
MLSTNITNSPRIYCTYITIRHFFQREREGEREREREYFKELVSVKILLYTVTFSSINAMNRTHNWHCNENLSVDPILGLSNVSLQSSYLIYLLLLCNMPMLACILSLLCFLSCGTIALLFRHYLDCHENKNINSTKVIVKIKRKPRSLFFAKQARLLENWCTSLYKLRIDTLYVKTIMC